MKLVTLMMTILLAASGAIAADTNKHEAKTPHQHVPQDGHKHDNKPAVQAPKLNLADVLQIKPEDYVLGDMKAPVTIFEYSSLSCPHCAEFHNSVLPKLEEKYITPGKVKLINRDFPLNEPALRGAIVARCDGAKYYTYLKVLFKSQADWAYGDNYLNVLKNIAKLGGMPAEKLEACLADKKLQETLLALRLKGEGIGISSTPAFYINGVEYKEARTLDGFSKAIDAALEGKKPEAPKQ